MSLLETLRTAQKTAMKARDKLSLGTIRMALAEVKQREIDGQKALEEPEVLAVITKMVKQRKDAATQYTDAQRQDLADIELAEITVLEGFLPQALTEDELAALIDQAISETQAAGMQDMGKVMAWLKPKVQGRADMGKLSGAIKSRLTA
jgi:hypothetical protein